MQHHLIKYCHAGAGNRKVSQSHAHKVPDYRPPSGGGEGGGGEEKEKGEVEEMLTSLLKAHSLS